MTITIIIVYVLIGALLFGYWCAQNEDLPKKDRIEDKNMGAMLIGTIAVWPLMLLSFVGYRIYKRGRS